MSINFYISDLFFNRDLEHTKIVNVQGHFIGFDDEKLREEAKAFLASLRALHVDCPAEDELLDDFLERV